MLDIFKFDSSFFVEILLKIWYNDQIFTQYNEKIYRADWFGDSL